ncbi:MAG: UbiA family prenyltransferase [Nannocystaceae bacterium]|nr:UbiA family prenyltransferase [Nannocystaceae bacterium]
MDAPSARTWARCLYALKPRSWPKLLVAALLGQVIGVIAAGRFDPLGAALGFGFTLFHLAFVVLVNDWGDAEVDGLKRRLFPESCSPKTIPDGILAPESVWQLGAGAGFFALGVAVLAETLAARPGATVTGALCLLLLACYTLPPVQLNYRGGGELLELLGVGFALPWWNAYVQSGQATPPELAWLPAFALLALASALASGLADEASDRLGGKRTFATMFGGARVRVAVEGLVVGAMLVLAAMSKLAPQLAQWWTTAPAVLLMSWLQRELARCSRAADVEEPEGIARYKQALHRLIWWGTAMLCATLLAGLWLGLA